MFFIFENDFVQKKVKFELIIHSLLIFRIANFENFQATIEIQ